MFGRAVAERRIDLTGDYPNDPSFVHFAGADRLVGTLGDPLVPRRADDRRRPRVRRHGHVLSRARRVRRSRVALVRALADHAAAAMANAELIDQLAGSRAEVERRAETERALREIGARITAVRDPARGPPAGRRRGGRGCSAADGARIDLLDDRDGGAVLGLRRDDRAPAGSRADRRQRRGEGRRGDLGPGGPRDAARLHRRLPQRRPLRARRAARRPRQALRDPVGRRRAARRRSRAARDADRLHRRGRRVHRGRRPAPRGAGGPGGDRDDERPPDRARSQHRRRTSAGGRTRSAPSARSRPGSPRSATRRSSSRTSSTRRPGCSAPSGSGST